MAGPAPSTATVLEFRCLFTHDLRRKQKRWQDGRLKYHTFNARVMVYDERGNSVGDMHWHGEYEFGEGEEVQLDRGGVIVQVEDLVERKETDLSELVDKRVQEKQQRQMQQLARSRASGSGLPHSLPRPAAVAPDRPQPPRHRPLHHVIGTPTGHHGKALVPKESPFEQRQQAAESPDERTAKRRKYDEPPPSKSGYASALFGQALTLSATPSSSVPTARRPRPEARSGPLPETDAQYSRGEPEPVRREQPQSSLRINHSGYAQSLFGQTLTLSHTPVSSVSLAPQQQIKSVLNTTVNGNAEESPQRPQNPAPPRLNERRQLDELSSKFVSDSLLIQSKASKASNRQAKDKGKGSADIGESNSCASLSEKHHATKSVNTIPEPIDVIEIDDPDPIALPRVRHPEMQDTQASLQRPGESSSSSKVEVRETLGPPADQVRSTRRKISEAGRQVKSKKAESNERTNKPDKAVAVANGRNASSGRADTTAHGVGSRSPDATRDPTLPVTELRIKSSKKRGLLMISDTSKAKKTRRQVFADAARSFGGDSTHSPRDSNDDDPFHQSSSTRPPSKFETRHGVGDSARARSMVPEHVSSNGDDNENDLEYPLLNRDGEWQKDGAVSELRKEAAVRTISTELGEDEDPFQAQSLAVSDRTYDRPESATRNADQQSGQERLEQTKAASQKASHSDMCFADNDGGELADISQPTKHSFSLSRVKRDSCQISSSSRASNPGSSSSLQTNGRDQDHKHRAGVDVLKPIDNNKKSSKAKRQRQSRRKVITDDDSVDPAALPPSNAEVGSDSGPGAISLVCDEAANKQLQSPKFTKTRAQELSPTVESGDEWSGGAARKTKGQEDGFGLESEGDELPLVRRELRRPRRPRHISSEPSPLPSEQDDSEEEEISRKRRKTKASKVSEDRPRLEKIKKNVKSRELVGLNLAALNAPLGLRGIGMPFSILPSPVSESVQTRVTTRVVADENRSPVVAESCGDQMLSSRPNPLAAPDKQDAQTQRKSLSAKSKRDETNDSPLDCSDPDANRSKSLGEDDSGALVEPDAPAYLKVPEIRDFGKSGGPWTGSQSPTTDQDKQAVGRAPSLKQSEIPQEPIPSKPSPEAKQDHATTPHDITTVEPAEQTISSLEKPARKPSPTLSRQSSTLANHKIFDQAKLEAPLKTGISAQRLSVPAQTTTTGPAINVDPLLRDQLNADGQEPSNTFQAAQSVTEAQPTDIVAANQRANISAKSQAATLLNWGQPSILEDSSTLESVKASNTVESNPNVQVDTSKAPSAADKPGSALHRHFLATGDQEVVTIQKAMGNADSDRASALPVRSPNAIGLRRQASAPRSINNVGAKLTPQAETTERSSTDVHDKPASYARLANPASRGRKAALAAHAAGPVPQRMLPPTQPTMMAPVSTADMAMTPIEQAPKQPERPKKKMTFPGFQSARSDGPWSREAFDLLESGKPE